MLVAYLFCKHKHIRTIVASLLLYKIKEVEANSNHNLEINNCECRTLAHVGIILCVKYDKCYVLALPEDQDYAEAINFQMLSK